MILKDHGPQCLRSFIFNVCPVPVWDRYTLSGGGVSLRSSCEGGVMKVQGSLCFTMATWEESQRLGQEQDKLTPTVQ